MSSSRPSTRCTAEALHSIATRVDRNVPSHRDPEKFHIEKSEIVQKLRRMARAEEGGNNER